MVEGFQHRQPQPLEQRRKDHEPRPPVERGQGRVADHAEHLDLSFQTEVGDGFLDHRQERPMPPSRQHQRDGQPVAIAQDCQGAQQPQVVLMLEAHGRIEYEVGPDPEGRQLGVDLRVGERLAGDERSAVNGHDLAGRDAQALDDVLFHPVGGGEHQSGLVAAVAVAAVAHEELVLGEEVWIVEILQVPRFVDERQPGLEQLWRGKMDRRYARLAQGLEDRGAEVVWDSSVAGAARGGDRDVHQPGVGAERPAQLPLM